jgi:hypothetical protein
MLQSASPENHLTWASERLGAISTNRAHVKQEIWIEMERREYAIIIFIDSTCLIQHVMNKWQC